MSSTETSSPPSMFETYDIAGHLCNMRSFDIGLATESYEAFMFYKPLKEWLIFPRAESRVKAIEEARRILSSPIAFGCFLMQKGAERIELDRRKFLDDLRKETDRLLAGIDAAAESDTVEGTDTV